MAEEAKPLEYINEVILKKRRTNEDWAIRRKQQLEERAKRSKHDNFVIKKPEQFVKEFRDKVIVIFIFEVFRMESCDNCLLIIVKYSVLVFFAVFDCLNCLVFCCAY